jgi:hypothetical protein
MVVHDISFEKNIREKVTKKRGFTRKSVCSKTTVGRDGRVIQKVCFLQSSVGKVLVLGKREDEFEPLKKERQCQKPERRKDFLVTHTKKKEKEGYACVMNDSQGCHPSSKI